MAYSLQLDYSVRNDFTGFVKAAFIDWKLTVNKAMANAATMATANVHQPIIIL